MVMDYPVKNIDELRLEIYRLKGLEKQQSAVIREHFKNPLTIFSSFTSLFSGKQQGEGIKKEGVFNLDIVQLISGILLPFTLNKTIFRRSNFLVKAIVRLFSQKASVFINESSVGSLWDKIKTLIPGKTKKENTLYNNLPNPK